MKRRMGAASLWVGLVIGGLTLGCSSGTPGADRHVYRMGEPVAVGPLIYEVVDTEWLSQLGEGISARFPHHRFLLIRVSITNSGAASSGVPPMALVDASGQRYHELSDGEGIGEWLGYLRTINPAQTERGRVLFDVPTGAYRLRVTNDADPGMEKAALIEIPLRLPPGVPGVPAER